MRNIKNHPSLKKVIEGTIFFTTLIVPVCFSFYNIINNQYLYKNILYI